MTNIEWVKNPDGTQGITVNSKTGCMNNCEYCYARKLAQTRLKSRYLANENLAPPYLDAEGFTHSPTEFAKLMPFYPRFWPERLEQIRKVKKPTGIFLDDMSDWMWEGWPEEWTRQEIQVMRDYPQHRFYTLTKQPQNLIKFSPFPENCFVGITVTNDTAMIPACHALEDVAAKIKFISFEPLLEVIDTNCIRAAQFYRWLDWLIIGACTGTYQEMSALRFKYPDLSIKVADNKVNERPVNRRWTAQPRIEWIREIVDAADKAGVKVFLKNNLLPLLFPEDCSKPNYLTEDRFWASEKAQLSQEMPE